MDGKLCVVYHCYHEYMIYVIDLNGSVVGDEFVRRLPTVRLGLSTFGLDGLCVVGSTLYVFEGRKIVLDDDACPITRSIFTFDLSSLPETSDRRLEKSDLNRVSEMRHSKIFPRAMPTPDGKILVFSTTLNHTALPYVDPFAPPYSARNQVADEIVADVVDFELYDPESNRTTSLPRICHNRVDRLQGYSVDSESTTFYLITEAGSFSLDLNRATQWNRLHLSMPMPGGRSFVIDNGICLSTSGGFHISPSLAPSPDLQFQSPLPNFPPPLPTPPPSVPCTHRPPVFPYPPTTFSSPFWINRTKSHAEPIIINLQVEGPFPLPFPSLPTSLEFEDRHMALLGGLTDDEQHVFCVSTGCVDQMNVPHVIIDVCSFDATKYVQGKSDGAELGIRVNKTLKFVVGDKPSYSFFGVDVFSM